MSGDQITYAPSILPVLSLRSCKKVRPGSMRMTSARLRRQKKAPVTVRTGAWWS